MGTEDLLVEQPILSKLQDWKYCYISREENESNRDGLNNVILKKVFIDSLIRINDITLDEARSIYIEVLSITDNDRWTHILRGNFSKTVSSSPTKKTIKFIDFKDTSNNIFTVTNQFSVKAEVTLRPDIVCFINGIPTVVIEAKSPVSFKDKTGEAFDQIKKYEKHIPRLFYTNMFNIITNGNSVLYGSTGSPSEYWGEWKDPYPKNSDAFNDELDKGLYSLLEPSRLLDFLAHFIIFEKRDNKIIKKMCRYQQFRAVNKIVDRYIENRKPRDRKGLIWHSTGSGKSLTMVFAALKLKTHLTINNSKLTSPNLLIVTDRVDLDDQIVGTFKACGLSNPVAVSSVKELRDCIHQDTNGLTLLATIFKFDGSRKQVKNSQNWIICVDESHRTQEKDLGAYLRKTFPEAYFFGFTGTPIKKADKNTYENFSPSNEMYLDKYSIEDAVADGATVPIYYTSRKTNWHLNNVKLDILFDQWFKDFDDKKKEAIKKKELTKATLLKHTRRVEMLAFDMWTHYKESAFKDGFKAQVVCIDREAIILYKTAFNNIIQKELMAEEGFSQDEALKIAETYTIPVYSENQTDSNESEDDYTQEIRDKLVQYKLSGNNRNNKDSISLDTEKKVKDAFGIKSQPPYMLIVCSKLLTGFDAPVESVMYLDNPLKDHNLLQAIARTNRVESEHKTNGLIVDYVGITENIHKALSSYRDEDIKNAMRNIDDLRSILKQAHHEVMTFLKKIKRKDRPDNDTLRSELIALLDQLSLLDNWLSFKRKAKAFIKAYESLSPDPYVLEFTRDLKWVSLIMPMGMAKFENIGDNDLGSYSGRIREMIAKELKVTGIQDIVKLRDIFDPHYWDDFDTEDKKTDDLKTSAVRKATELKKTISTLMLSNDIKYEPFSKRLKEILNSLEDNQVDFAQKLKDMEKLSKDLQAEKEIHKGSGLNENAHGVHTILKAFEPEKENTHNKKTKDKKELGDDYTKEKKLTKLQEIALHIDELYSSDDTAPRGWHLKEQLRKELRIQVRRMVCKLDLKDWKFIPQKIEEFAIKHYEKP